MRPLAAAVAAAVFAFAASASARAEPFGKASGGLAVGVGADKERYSAGDPILLTITLKNVGKKALAVRSHVATHETHLDWHRVVLAYPTPSREGCRGRFTGRGERRLALDDERDKSAPVTATLEPGATLVHTVDLQDWAGRKRNGARAVEPGFYQVEVVYEVQGEKDAWVGRVRSNRARFTIDGAPPAGRCARNPGWQYW